MSNGGPIIFPRTAVQWVLVVTLLMVDGGHAARQGELGRTSTATANITLRILPGPHNGTALVPNRLPDGYSALLAWCRSASPFNRPTSLFTARLSSSDFSSSDLSTGDLFTNTLINHPQAAEIDQLLRTRCRGQTHLPRTATGTGQQPMTVLISPI